MTTEQPSVPALDEVPAPAPSTRRSAAYAALAVSALALGGLAAPTWLLFLATMALAHGLAVLGVVVLTRGGGATFGQGMFFAIGAYAAAILPQHLGVTDALVRLVAGTLAAGLAAALVAPLLARYRGIFFAMLTLALSMVLFGLLSKSSALGGSDGIPVAAATLFGAPLAAGRRELALYLLTLACSAAAGVAVLAHWRSAAGLVAQAVRGNALRVEYLGASARASLATSFVVGALLGGLGGALTALALGHVEPNLTNWTTSGEFVFAAVLAGHHSVVAVFVASFVLEIVRSFSNLYFPNTWQLVLGVFLLVVIVLRPEGLGSLWRGRRRGGARAAANAVATGAGAHRPADASGMREAPAQPAEAAASGATPMLDVRGVVKRFGAVVAADDITLSIPAGQRLSVIGSNGAGKTTFVNLVTGYLAPDAGTIALDGRDVGRLGHRRLATLGICRSFQIPQLFLDLTLRENLLVAVAAAEGRPSGWRAAAAAGRGARADALVARLGLQADAERPVAELAGGVRKLADIAMALARRPRLLLLDEPTSGVSADEKFDAMHRVMAAVAGEAATVVFVEHDMDIVAEFSERVVAFDAGRVIADGVPAAVLAAPEVRRRVTGHLPMPGQNPAGPLP